MKQGDFTRLAKHYVHRTGYSLSVLRALALWTGALPEAFPVADVGAGTGKLTENLAQLGLSGFAVEPNAAMREEGARQLKDQPGFVWSEGSAERTGLPDNSVGWVLMGSSFHWTDAPAALAEFRRILRPGGYFTALWNPRDLEDHPLHARIEKRIHEIAPNIQRVSSGSSKYTQGLEKKLLEGGLFRDVLFMEGPHEVTMTPDRYLGAWKSVNDIQAQAGEEKFQEILRAIEQEIAGLQEVVVPYRTRAWTVQSTKT